MRDETTIRECPFCGGEAETVGDDILGWKVECMKCGAGTRTCCITEAEAIAEWNTRAERTCRNVAKDDSRDEFVCSECGHVDGAYEYGSEVGEHCKGCGAKVVDA